MGWSQKKKIAYWDNCDLVVCAKFHCDKTYVNENIKKCIENFDRDFVSETGARNATYQTITSQEIFRP